MSKADVNKIVELVLSDDETNQELGCIMAVSQGLKDEVLKKLHWEVLKTIQELFMYPVTDFQCYQLISQYFEGQKITHVEAYDPSSHEPHLIYHKKVTGIADMFIKLKNYNHE